MRRSAGWTVGLMFSVTLSVLLAVGVGRELVDELRPASSARVMGVPEAPAVTATDEIPSSGPVPVGCVRIQGSKIGQLPLDLEVGGAMVSFKEWNTKEYEGEEYIGFAVSSDSSVRFAVQAGSRTFQGEGNRWLHPNGVSGARVGPISNVTVCADAPTLVTEAEQRPHLSRALVHRL